MNKLAQLGLDALKKSSEELTFNIKNVDVRPSKTGKVGYKVETDQGKVVTFWDSTMDAVIEEVNEARGEYAVKPGTTLSSPDAQGFYGLIPNGTSSNGFWS